MMQCWQIQPDDRPSFSQLLTFLSSQLVVVADYMDFNDQEHARHRESDTKLGDNDVFCDDVSPKAATEEDTKKGRPYGGLQLLRLKSIETQV